MKINVYINGEYVYSTKRFKTCKAAITDLKEKTGVKIASIPDYQVILKHNDKVTARRCVN